MKRMMVAGLLVAAMGVTSYAQSPDASLYAGVKSCGMCHKKDEVGNQLGKWQESKHAKAFEVLGTPEAKEAGKKAGVDDPQKSGKCLKCHATAYNFAEAGPVVEKITPEEGVTCESCHGPGKNYKSKEMMKDRAQAVANGLIYPATKSCEKCHNKESPTWNPERYTKKDGSKAGFDAEQAFEKIKHPDPNVKHE
jgi:hypothetical protein